LSVHSRCKYLAHLRQQDFLRHSLEAVGHSRRCDALHDLEIVLAENAAVGQQRRRVVFAGSNNITTVFTTSHHSISAVDLAYIRVAFNKQ